MGFVGSVVVGILERCNLPVKEFEVSSKSIEIDGEHYNLEKSISMDGNEINLKSASITIDDEGMIDHSTLNSTLAKSKSRISLHGIIQEPFSGVLGAVLRPLEQIAQRTGQAHRIRNQKCWLPHRIR